MVVEPKKKVYAPHQLVLTTFRFFWSQTTLTKSGHADSSQVHLMFANCRGRRSVLEKKTTFNDVK